MPTVRVDGQAVQVPPIVLGASILDLPEMKTIAGKDRTVFMVDPTGDTMEIIDPERQYQPKEGAVLDSTAASVSGGRA